MVTWGTDTGTAYLRVKPFGSHCTGKADTLFVKVVQPVTATVVKGTEYIAAYANGKPNSLTVKATNLLSGIVTVQVNTITGTELLAQQIDQNGGSFYKEFTLPATDQLLIIRIVSADNVYTTKIILD